VKNSTKVKFEYSEHLEKILKNLPKNPGVYQMKDADAKVIYVGKAKNLMNRVRSYFDRTSELSPAKKQMVAKIRDIEIILCDTEVEALVLETNLIKHLTPKYNILMKDDKNLAYIKITNSPVPELIKTRQKYKDGAEYFGPYVSAVEMSVRALRRIFRIRNCRMKFESRYTNAGDRNTSESKAYEITITDKAWKTIPCMDYYIGLCPAPCLLEREWLDEQRTHIDRVRRFLSGEGSWALRDLEMQMHEKAKNLEFEKAQEIKEMIESLKWLSEKQKVRDIVEGDIDIFLKYEKYDKVYFILMQVRRSQIIGVFRHEVSPGAEEWDDIVISFLMKQYSADDGTVDLPDLLILRDEIHDEAFLEYIRTMKIRIEYPQIGPKKDLLEFAERQIKEYAYKRELTTLENKTLTREHMTNILERLGYPVPKKWEIVFECYDISHTDGHFTYASRVVIVNGKPDPSRYKKYKIKTLIDGEIDDFASHREVMFRRTLEWLEQENFPHLIIIDWGKGQLTSALSGIQEWKWKHERELSNTLSFRMEWNGVRNPLQDENIEQDISLRSIRQELIIPICSIAKREEEIFLPREKAPILFEKGTPELMVLQKARDESHRFSITANKTARMKSMKKNILEELPWIGPLTRKKLLKLAGSVDDIKNLTEEELSILCTKTQIQTLRDHGILN
jgi:excinuclease ABC subunit C